MLKKERGVTLIELLVAIALMVVLTSSISFIFVTARNVFSQSEATIQVYQNARNAFDIIEKDLSIAVKTHDMDFFMDDVATPNGHFDAGEEFHGLNPEDPKSDTKSDYAYSMTIYGREYPDPKFPGRQPHKSDMIYFKSLTTIGGKTRSALILYKIDISKPTKPILKKYVLYRGEGGTAGLTQDPPDGSGQDLCLYVTDMKIEYYFDNVLDSKAPGYFDVQPNQEKVFAYLGTGSQGKTDASGVFSTPSFDDTFADNFGQLSARDRIFLYGAPTPWTNNDSTDYIIDTISTTGELSFSNLGKAVPLSIGGISFRAGYLPPALKFTLKIMDTKGMQVRTISRVVRLQSH